MLKLLIVEDEKNTREGLRDYIDWGKYEIKVVHDVSNGQKALEYVQEHPVDIIMTDIVMPIMDGIELTRRIQEMNMSIKIIFISGYWDMQYLKSAFQLDAIDYILKPIKLTELDDVLKKVVNICKEEKKQDNLLKQMKSKADKGIFFLRKQFISSILAGEIENVCYIRQRIEYLELPFGMQDYFAVFSAGVDILPSKHIINNLESNEMLIFKINAVLAKNISQKRGTFLFLNDDDYLVIIFSCCMGICDEQLMNVGQQLQESIEQVLGYKVSIGIGHAIQGIEQIGKPYLESVAALEKRYFFENQKVMFFTYSQINRKNKIVNLSRQQEKILNTIKAGKDSAIEKQTNAFFEYLQNSRPFDIEYVQTSCIELVIMSYKIFYEINDFVMEENDEKYLWKQILQFKTLSETKSWMCEHFKKMSQNISNLQKNESAYIVKKMKEFINMRYAENITTQTLADEFFLTPNYICQLFKKHGNETFNQYLTRVRMQKAKEIMDDPTKKFYEIADMVGYNDPDYFTKVFKRHTGMTPSEYREGILKWEK